MLYSQLFLAATAAAFLVVPEVSEKDKETVSTLPFPIDVNAASSGMPLVLMEQSVSIPCSQCKGENAQVEMDFAIEDGTRLTLNGFELYPTADPWHDDLTAAVQSEGETSKEQPLGYGLFIKPEAVDVEQQLSLTSVELRVVEVGHEFVKGVPAVTVKIVKAPSGEIVIGSIDVEEVSEEAEHSFNKALQTVKEKVESFWKKLKSGCGRHRQGSGHISSIHGKRPHHGSPPFRHDSPHGHRHNHHHRHGWAKLIRNVVSTILLPILAGITAGVGVAVLTLGLCSCFALVFRARRRRCRRAAAHLAKAAPTEAAHVEEKAGLMDAQDPPPQYVDDEQAK